jgi:hypothetical protein
MKGITLQEMSDDTIRQLHANYVRQPAFAYTEGSAGAYTVTLDPKPTSISDGFGITIVPHVANEADVTLNINELGALSLKDQKGKSLTAGKLQVGKPYTFRKIGMDFLADSSGGSGDAVAGDIRAGKTATTDNGEVTGTLPVRSGGTVIPVTFNQTKQAGIYDSDIVVQGSSNLVAGNIKSGISIFGVNGNVLARPTVGYVPSRTGITVPARGTLQIDKPANISEFSMATMTYGNSGQSMNEFFVYIIGLLGDKNFSAIEYWDPFVDIFLTPSLTKNAFFINNTSNLSPWVLYKLGGYMQ